MNVGVDTGLRRLIRKKLIKIMDGMYNPLMSPLYFIIKYMLEFSKRLSYIKIQKKIWRLVSVLYTEIHVSHGLRDVY